MAVRVIKSLNKTGQTSRQKARSVAKAIRVERSDSLIKTGSHVVITRGTTASGKDQITFRAANVIRLNENSGLLAKGSRRGHG